MLVAASFCQDLLQIDVFQRLSPTWHVILSYKYSSRGGRWRLPLLLSTAIPMNSQAESIHVPMEWQLIVPQWCCATKPRTCQKGFYKKLFFFFLINYFFIFQNSLNLKSLFLTSHNNDIFKLNSFLNNSFRRQILSTQT